MHATSPLPPLPISQELTVFKALEEKIAALDQVQTDHDLQIVVQSFSGIKAPILELVNRCRDATRDLLKARKQQSKTKPQAGAAPGAKVDVWKVFTLESPVIKDTPEFAPALGLRNPMLIGRCDYSKVLWHAPLKQA